MNEIVGYCEISKNATTCAGATNPSEFIGKVCRVMEFDNWGGVLVLNSEATALAMFDKEDVLRSFKCKVFNNQFVMPPNLDFIGEAAYASRCMSRKGGYNNTLMQMVIQASLSKGVFTDSFLWQLQ